MKQLVSVLILAVISACSGTQPKLQPVVTDYYEITDFNPTDTLFLVTGGEGQLTDSFCYLNQKGDTIIPYGQFERAFSDTILTYGIVVEQKGGEYELIGINQKGQRLYEVKWYDNGPDYIEDGLFRIIRNGKTGYADTTGKIRIAPEFDCAFPFSEGRAKVSHACKLEKDGDHTFFKSNEWFYVDVKGKKIE